MKLRVSTREQLPKCWLFNGKSYILTAKGGETIDRKLPYVGSKYESLLKEHGIACRLVTVPNRYDESKEYQVCEYWDPEFYETEDIKLPVYTKMQGEENTYLYTGEVLSQKVVTGKTIGMALKMRERVKYECTKKDLDGKMGKVMHLNIDKKEINLEGPDGCIKMLQAYTATGNPTKYYGVFNMNKVEGTPYIQVDADTKESKSLAIGKNGQNAKYWSSLLKGKKIMIV